MLTRTAVCAATGASASGVIPEDFTGVSTDSRSIAPGDLFVALRGDFHDGRDYASQAVQAGAHAVLVTAAIEGLPCLVVPDTLVAYGQIAAAHLRSLRSTGLQVVGLTGSSGKTTTKDLLSSVLGRRRRVVAAQGSLNNDIGLPATVLRADASTEVLVLEMGMRGLGHIQRLCEVAAPDISVVLNVGHAHIGELGSQAAIAHAKAEIVEYANVGAVAVLNGDDLRTRDMAAMAHGDVVFFGEGEDCSVRATDVVMSEQGAARFVLNLPDGSATAVELAVIGRHQVSNACAVAAVADLLGISADDIASGLMQAQVSSHWRMQLSHTRYGVTVLNDAYNANPDSMAAALRALAQFPCEGKRVAIVGEMLELGQFSQQAHTLVGSMASELGIDHVIAVGHCAEAIMQGRSGADTDVVSNAVQATQLALSLLAPGDVVLVKASRSVGLERVGIDLVQQFGTVSA